MKRRPTTQDITWLSGLSAKQAAQSGAAVSAPQRLDAAGPAVFPRYDFSGLSESGHFLHKTIPTPAR